MTFEPDSELSAFTFYDVKVFFAWVTDTSGNLMVSDFTSSFTTGQDTNPPYIVEVDPVDSSIDVPISTVVKVTFSEPMDAASTEGAFSLSDGITDVVGPFSWSGNTMIFTPDSKLSDLTLYDVTVTTSAEDISGNPITARLNSTFTPGVVVDIAVGNEHTVVVLSGGTVKTLGANFHGQLGNDNGGYSRIPFTVSGITAAVAVAAVGITNAEAVASGVSSNTLYGGNHTAALLSDGKVMAWGDNEYGQLGNGSTTDSSIPVEVSGITNATAIAAGGFHTVALLSDGLNWARTGLRGFRVGNHPVLPGNKNL